MQAARIGFSACPQALLQLAKAAWTSLAQVASVGWHAASAVLRALTQAALQVLLAACAGFSHVPRVVTQAVAHATPSGAAKQVG